MLVYQTSEPGETSEESSQLSETIKPSSETVLNQVNLVK